MTDGRQERRELVEDCRYCGDPVDIERGASYKTVSDRFAHADCMADHCYEDRELVATTEGTFRIKPVAVIEKEGREEQVIESYWRADCPMCWQTHETESQDEALRGDLVEQVIDCCDPVEWLPPKDYIEDCDICGDDHRKSGGCTVLSRREPFPRPENHEFECADCDWSGSTAEDFDTHTGRCPECGTAAVRAIQVATDGGQCVDGIERKPNCDMPECVGEPGDEKRAVRDPSGELLELCDGCLDDGWRQVVEVIE